VLLDQGRGLTVTLYLPFYHRLFGGYIFGDMLVLQAEPEGRSWLSVSAI
jgi:hypothetical protein